MRLAHPLFQPLALQNLRQQAGHQAEDIVRTKAFQNGNKMVGNGLSGTNSRTSQMAPLATAVPSPGHRPPFHVIQMMGRQVEEG